MRKGNAVGYAGDLFATDACELPSTDVDSALVDVRTLTKWAYVGVPDPTSIGKAALFLEWQSFPATRVDTGFAARLSALLQDARATKEAPVLFLPRFRARSRHAAIAMTSAGWTRCFNIRDGFDGPLDPWRRRNVVGGWTAVNLPRSQS
jgi:rhodanese-related sulfurtransferase